MTEYKFDTQLLIEGNDLKDIEIRKYFEKNFDGDSTIIVGMDELIKVHFHTNEPWKVLEYCAQLGEIYDVVIENMERQARGERG
ncbi:MAG: kinase to dihydroxyacetone kinase [Clostridia bacterium]|nr:kinase to dihydroxyacetone kinase [Clostridia bacterium]